MEKHLRKVIYKKAISHFGPDSQRIVAIEELSELINELAKSLVGKDKRGLEGLIDELADSKIMIEQLECLYEIEDDVNLRMEVKITRLNGIIDGKIEHPQKDGN